MGNLKLHVIELEDKKGNVFQRFNDFEEYDDYLSNLAVDLRDEDCDVDLDFTAWFCYFINGEILSFKKNQLFEAVMEGVLNGETNKDIISAISKRY